MPRCPNCRALNNMYSTVCTRCGKDLQLHHKPDDTMLDAEPLDHGSKKSSDDFSETNHISSMSQASEKQAESLPSEHTALEQFTDDSFKPNSEIEKSQNAKFSSPSFSNLDSEISFYGNKSVNSASEQTALDYFSAQSADLHTQQRLSPGPVTSAGPEESMDLSSRWTHETPRHRGTLPTLTGNVFITKDVAAEPPDFDIFIWLSRIFGLMLILGLPVVLIGHAYQRFGVILIYILVALIFLLSRFGGGIFLISILGLGGLLGSFFRSRDQQIPVRTCRIMDEQQREHIVRIKGRMIRGDIHEYDRVAIWGRWRDGTLMFRRGYNFRARSWIQLEGRYTWILALIFGLLNVWLLFELSRIFPGWAF